MAFTYTDTLLTDRDRVRFEIGDITSGSGPRPDSSNFSDAEVGAIITAEGSWGAAAARLAEVLANSWATAAGSVTMADYSENYSDRANYWRKRAQDLRRQYGGGLSTSQTVFTRVDGYSDDIDSEET